MLTRENVKYVHIAIAFVKSFKTLCYTSVLKCAIFVKSWCSCIDFNNKIVLKTHQFMGYTK